MSTQIKTPEEIAGEIAREVDARGGTSFMGGPIYTPNEYRAEIARRAIEADRAQRVSERSITINPDTGEWLSDTRITGEEGARVAASVLPGVTPEQVSGRYSEWLSKW